MPRPKLPPSRLSRRARMAIQRRREPTGRPATLGTTERAHLALIVWCKECAHQVEPDVAEHVARYGPDLTLLDWQQRLVCPLWRPGHRFRGERLAALRRRQLQRLAPILLGEAAGRKRSDRG